MLPLVDKPIIQYGVEEAMAAGCDQIIIITGRGKSAIEDHFDVSYELEKMLEEKGKTDLLKIVRQISDMIHVAYVRQKEALGLGHAVLTARELVGDEPFAALLADDVIDSKVPCLKQLMDVFDEKQCFGDCDPGHRRAGDFFVRRAESEGSPGFGRQALRGPRSGGKTEARRRAFESGRDRAVHSDARPSSRRSPISSPVRAANCNLPTALRGLLKREKMYAYVYEGRRHDTGDKLGFLKATVEFALKREDLGGEFREYLKGLRL